MSQKRKKLVYHIYGTWGENKLYWITNSDSKKLLTASGDKTCKIFDIETGSVVNEFNMGSEIRDQQLGCLWQNEHLLSVSLSGYINYLDPNT